MTALLSLLSVLILVGCSTAAAPDSTAPTTSIPGDKSPPVETSTIPDRLLIDLEEEVVDSVISLASQALDLETSKLRPVIAVAVTWEDESFNCSQPGEDAAATLTDGLWVVLTDGSRIYDYRAGEDGTFGLCENGGPPATTRVGS